MTFRLIFLNIVLLIFLLGCTNGSLYKPEGKPSDIDSAKDKLKLDSKRAMINVIDFCQDRIKEEPNDARAYAIMGKAYALLSLYAKYEGKKYNEYLRLALKNTNKAYEMHKEFPIIYNARAYALMASGRYISAETFARKARKLEPDEADHFFLLWLITEPENTDSELIKRTLELDSKHVAALNRLSIQLILDGKTDEAKKLLEKVLNLDPNNVIALGNIAHIYAKNDQYDKAKYYIVKARRVEPENTILNYNIGMYFLNKNNYKQAVLYFNKALNTNPLNIRALKSLASTYCYNLGQPEEAVSLIDNKLKTVYDISIRLELLRFKEKLSKELRKTTLDKVMYTGGNGRSISKAIIITGDIDEFTVIHAIHEYIKQNYLDRGKRYQVRGEYTLRKNKRVYNVVKLLLPDKNKRIKLYFDVTEYFKD